MRRIGPAAAVLVATGVDVGGLLALRAATGWPVAVADAVALAVAAPVSYALHRLADRGADPFVRWVSDPHRFARVAVVAGAVDVAVLSLLVAPLDAPGLGAVAAAKAVALLVAALVRVVGQRRIHLRTIRADQAAPTRRDPAPGSKRFSVVLPAYHHAGLIADTVRRVRDAVGPKVGPGQLEVIVVDDGSADATEAEARRGGADLVVVHERNRGKGAAVRSGVAVAQGATIAFTDADLAYRPELLLDVLAAVEEGWDVAVGSRRHTDTVTLVRAGRVREVGGRLINLLTQAVLLGHYRDTQCGLKGFRSDAARLVVGEGHIDGFAFDVELFHLVERHGLSLVELPVQVANSSTSTVRVVRDGLALVRDVFRIRRFAAEGAYSKPVRTDR